jgi:hypothetical protein
MSFSGRFQFAVFSGLPTFDKLTFDLGPREQLLDIHVRYIGSP